MYIYFTYEVRTKQIAFVNRNWAMCNISDTMYFVADVISFL